MDFSSRTVDPKLEASLLRGASPQPKPVFVRKACTKQVCETRQFLIEIQHICHHKYQKYSNQRSQAFQMQKYSNQRSQTFQMNSSHGICDEKCVVFRSKTVWFRRLVLYRLFSQNQVLAGVKCLLTQLSATSRRDISKKNEFEAKSLKPR